ncbi:hypothetical protein HOY80DRAFT_5688 [Tuber brumale]|nr:hypothetical protein HOY80DRAFT_5688 [Tuber brumale]
MSWKVQSSTEYCCLRFFTPASNGRTCILALYFCQFTPTRLCRGLLCTSRQSREHMCIRSTGPPPAFDMITNLYWSNGSFFFFRPRCYSVGMGHRIRKPGFMRRIFLGGLKMSLERGRGGMSLARHRPPARELGCRNTADKSWCAGLSRTLYSSTCTKERKLKFEVFIWVDAVGWLAQVPPKKSTANLCGALTPAPTLAPQARYPVSHNSKHSRQTAIRGVPIGFGTDFYRKCPCRSCCLC